MSTRPRPGLVPHHRRRFRRLAGSRGAVAVETAILGSLTILLFFGALEFGLLLRTRAAMTDATREGARVAATLPRIDGFQNSALAAVAGVAANLRNDSLQWVTIYRADPLTGLPASGEPLESCYSDCWMFEYAPGVGFQQKLGASWPATDQRACGDAANTDWIGVYVRGRHDWVTGVLGGGRTLTDRVVMRLEPMDPDERCRP